MKINKVGEKVGFAIFMAVFSAQSFAQQQFRLNDIRGTSGAGTNDLTALTTKTEGTANNFANFLILIFSFIGLCLVGISLYGLYKASKEERESPKGAIWGLIIGAALTAVPLILGYTRNSLSI